MPPRKEDKVGFAEIVGYCRGALQEKANAAMRKVLDNMQDPNTPWKNKREIAIKISFRQNEDRDDTAVEVSVDVKFAGTVEQGTVAEYGDTGVTQKATVKTGIATKSDAVVPNPVKLRPYRTFMEVEQPVSEFIFRMRDSGDITCALFEADGGAWKNVAMQNIKNYLELELADYKEHFTVIS